MAYDDQDPDTTGAIQTEEQSQPTQGQPDQAQPASAGMIDMGPPPVGQQLATETVGQGASELGQQLKSDIGQGIQNIQKDPIVKRIISYLSGADGNPAGALKGAAAVKQEAPHLSNDDAALISIDRTAQTQGPEAAWKELQGHRVAYNAKLAFAKVALDGTQGKPPNLASAIDATNKAMMHMPDGSNVQFTPSQGGVTATVRMPGTTQPQQIPMSIDQFKQFVDVGGSGQWDRVHARGVPATLSALARGQGPAKGATRLDQARPLQKPQAQDDDAGTTPDPNAEPPARSAFGETADQRTPDGARPWIPPRTGNYGNELENRAAARFPSIGENQQRLDWMAQQEEKQAERENTLNVAKTKADAQREVADTIATGRLGAADIRGQHQEATADITGKHREGAAKIYSAAKEAVGLANLQRAAQREEQLNGRNARNVAMRGLAAKVQTGQALNPKEQAQWDQIMAMTPEPQTAGSTQRPAQPSGQRPAASQDQQAIAWANAHPDDPRAAKIKQLHGMQ